MRSNYKKLGPYVRQVDIRNKEGKEENLLGVSTQKIFIESIANTVGTDFTKYKIVKRNQFTYVPDTSRRGDKIGLAMLDHLDEGIVSQAYTVFEIIDHDALDPEYLMMWFRRPEFDRYARYMSHGSVREIFGWEEMCDVELPIPSIAKQREIVREYNVIVNRIKLNEQLNQKLEETAQAIYKHWFVDFEFPISAEYATSIGKPELEGNPYKSSGGEMVFCEELDQEIPQGWEILNLKNIANIKGGKRLPKGETLISTPTKHPYIKVANMGKNKYVSLNQNFEYVPEDIQKTISRYTVNKNDLILSIVGTIGLIRIVDASLECANLTENCVKITISKQVSSDYLYYFLNSWTGQNEIEMKTVGGVQGKLPIYNIEAMRVLCLDKRTMSIFDKTINSIKSSQTLILPVADRLNQTKNIIMSLIAIEHKNYHEAS